MNWTAPQAFTVIRSDRAASPVDAGATVYRCIGWDYGCSNEDTRRLGIEHVAVTMDPTGDYPFFTVPREDLSAATASPAGGSSRRLDESK